MTIVKVVRKEVIVSALNNILESIRGKVEEATLDLSIGMHNIAMVGFPMAELVLNRFLGEAIQETRLLIMG